MQNIFVSYVDCETGDNFEFSRTLTSHQIGAALSVAVDILRMMKFGDELIREFIGTTCFEYDDDCEGCSGCDDCEDDCDDDDHCDCCECRN